MEAALTLTRRPVLITFLFHFQLCQKEPRVKFTGERALLNLNFHKMPTLIRCFHRDRPTLRISSSRPSFATITSSQNLLVAIIIERFRELDFSDHSSFYIFIRSRVFNFLRIFASFDNFVFSRQHRKMLTLKMRNIDSRTKVPL